MRWQQEVRETLDSLLKSEQTPRAAVFDADGTLWYDDLGEAFFRYQVQNHLAPGVHGLKDPWLHYKNLCMKDHHAGYGWLAQINAGLPVATLRTQAADFYRRTFKPRVCPLIRELFKELTENGFDIWVCTASQRWAMEPALKDLGVPLERLVAVETVVDTQGIITKELLTPIPYRAGKKIRLETMLHEAPLLVAGNSMGDFEMLSMAKKISLVINYLPHLPEIKESEEALLEEAAEQGWLIQYFE